MVNEKSINKIKKIVKFIVDHLTDEDWATDISTLSFNLIADTIKEAKDHGIWPEDEEEQRALLTEGLHYFNEIADLKGQIPPDETEYEEDEEDDEPLLHELDFSSYSTFTPDHILKLAHRFSKAAEDDGAI